ncbi:MAG TPA: type II toxin-antitoxin system YafQ family toxin [Candidatus Paceibacterota bacterium]|nr:type II toxin-antitoxin system YafQ family toxin [Candidatus Paceibacterota bacterium]
MKGVTARSGFHRELKRMLKRGYDRAAFDDALSHLRTNSPLPFSARPHKLSGRWKNHWECHLGFDWLLIYEVTDTEVVLVSTGTHADLFE